MMHLLQTVSVWEALRFLLWCLVCLQPLTFIGMGARYMKEDQNDGLAELMIGLGVFYQSILILAFWAGDLK